MTLPNVIGKHYVRDARMFVDGWLAGTPEGQSERLSLLQLGLFIVAVGHEVRKRLHREDSTNVG